eukprot:589270_1
MDALGSYPRMQYHTSSTYNQDEDHGSWFGLAISGLKFLIQNQNNNNINHNLSAPHHSSTIPNTKRSPNEKKLHILGPSVFRKKLYDIPERNEVQSTQNTQMKTNARLTKQSLQQFNGNFSNYWNQRSSLHSHSHASDHGDMEEVSNAGSIQTNQTASTIHSPNELNEEHHHPSMTSSQIIHPTQCNKPQLRRSRSYPLLSCDEYIQDLQHFSHDMMVSNIPSPPPTSTTPGISNDMLLPHVKTVHPIISSESINSSNFTTIGSESDIDACIVYYDRDFIREQRQKQRQWMRQNLYTMMRHSNNGSDVESNETLQVISSPIPKSIKTILGMKKRDNDEGSVFSDWSNVSSNISGNVPQNK